jgi:hypothetical protein
MRRAMAAALTSGGPPPDGVVFGIVGAGSPVHSSGLAAATATRPPIRLIPVPASLPTAEIVRRLNAAQPPALISYATKLAELAHEQREGRLRRLRQAGVTRPHVSARRVEALDRDALTGKSRRFIPLGPEARTF